MISIIIPVYNSIKYLSCCVESIISQEYKEWEIILIDDGSTDGSSHECDVFALKDSRISVIHTDNQGVSHARNIGIKSVKGDYIMFVDSDDYIDNNYLSSFIKYASADLIVGGYKTFGIINNYYPQREDYFSLKGNWDKIDVTTKNPKINAIYHICGKLYKTSIIKDHALEFSLKMKLAEDTCFNLSYLQYCHDIYFVHESGYNYRMNHIFTKYRFNFKEYCSHAKTFLGCCDDFSIKTKYRLLNCNNTILLAFLLAFNKDVAGHSTYKRFIIQSKYIVSRSLLPTNKEIIYNKRDRLLYNAYKNPVWGYFYINVDKYLHAIYMCMKIYLLQRRNMY